MVDIGGGHVCKCCACLTIMLWHSIRGTCRSHDECKADYTHKQLGMQLETAVQLQDDSGIVEYELVLCTLGKHVCCPYTRLKYIH